MPSFDGVPKVELHCHLVGVISPDRLRNIRRDGGQVLVEPDVLAALQPIDGIESFKRWISALKPYHSAPPEFMRAILEAHVLSLRAQGVIYTEMMISPAMFSSTPKHLVDAVREWRQWATDMEHGEIQLEFLMVIPRTLAPEVLERDTATYLELAREKLIAGVALVGPESGESIARFARSFQRWHDAGLGVEVHAGEHSGPEAVWDAIRYARPRRIGHGLSAFRDAKLLEHLHANHIHLEFCPSSNLCTGAVEIVQQLPIPRARDMGLSFSINTDDPGGFGCSLSSEYQLVAETFHFDKEDFEHMSRNALAARFVPALRHR